MDTQQECVQLIGTISLDECEFARMSIPPPAPKLYHIVHWDRLKPIVASNGLLSDVELGLANPGTTIGMAEIKRRRMSLDISCYADLRVGECVPFYFCPRSVMLYLLHRSNHPNLQYRGGQDPIVHLQFDMHSVREWAVKEGLRWCFTKANAGASYTEHYCDPGEMSLIDWQAVASTQWSNPATKEAKQAEFLVEQRVPWELVESIGVRTRVTAQQVNGVLPTTGHRPPVAINSKWYY